MSGLAGHADEEAVQEGLQKMVELCGNEGQRSIIKIGAEVFTMFSWGALEVAGAPHEWDDFAQIMEAHLAPHENAWQATNLIWEDGYEHVMNQFGYHDAFDESGEGAGQ